MSDRHRSAAPGRRVLRRLVGPGADRPHSPRRLSRILAAILAVVGLGASGCSSAATQKWSALQIEIDPAAVVGEGEAVIDLVGVGEADVGVMRRITAEEYWAERPRGLAEEELAELDGLPVLRLPALSYARSGIRATNRLFVDDEQLREFLRRCRETGRHHVRVAVDLYGTPEGYLATWLPLQSKYWTDGFFPAVGNSIDGFFGGHDLVIRIGGRPDRGEGVVTPVPSYVRAYDGPDADAAEGFLVPDLEPAMAGGGR